MSFSYTPTLVTTKVKIVDAYPPNFDKIVTAFPGARRKGVMFTYGPVVYAPHGVRVTSALKRHEQMHSDRQAKIGVDNWWDRYIVDPQFRFDEELLAHRAEYDWFRTFRPNKCPSMLRELATRLSSDLYGSVVSHHEAASLILQRRLM